MINLNKPKELTPEEVQQFEANNKSRGKVQLLRFASDVDPNKPAQFQVAKPGRVLMSAVADTAPKSNEKANDMMINGCVLAGDVDQLEGDTEMYFGLIEEIGKLFETKKKL